MPDSKKFFVVWSPQGGPPMVRLASFKTARSSAIRLATKHPDQDFFVLESCWGKEATTTDQPVDVSNAVEPDPPGVPRP